MNKLLKVLELLDLADQEYAVAKASGASTLLQPNNFQAGITALAEIFAPAPAAPAAPPAA
jgi:hypothetical protein